MTTAIGIAVWLPAMPTSGAAAAPKINGSSPKSADALPADFPWLCMAKEPPDVETIPMQETTVKSGIKTNMGLIVCYIHWITLSIIYVPAGSASPSLPSFYI
ncbi:hypothetical protein ACH95_17045 [Bacillus glycinifermentans]|nr:hypothetical protein ACH95_17045 [Bacillus glycinifermentans]